MFLELLPDEFADVNATAKPPLDVATSCSFAPFLCHPEVVVFTVNSGVISVRAALEYSNIFARIPYASSSPVEEEWITTNFSLPLSVTSLTIFGSS